MVSRRDILLGAPTVVAGAAVLARSQPGHASPGFPLQGRSGPGSPAHARSGGAHGSRVGRTLTPGGSSLPFTMQGGVKVFRLTAEPVRQEFAPGLVVDAWGYNGTTPGPTIEAVEGDRVRILVTNKLPEPTAVHWHGLRLPNGMDGVGGLTQRHIPPGETFAYEFTLKQHGTQMYHPHSDEMVQMAMGLMGFFIIHPKKPEPIDRDFAIFLHEWAIKPGTSVPDPSVMLDFSHFTFNGRTFPATAPLLVERNDRVRLRFANVTMDSHPMHLHGHSFFMSGTDGGQVPHSAQFPETTVNVPPGTTRTVDFTADEPGDWPLHCHKSHHTMNGMGHDLPNMIGVDQRGVSEQVAALVPGYMPMGSTGMGGMHAMGAPRNTIPMMTGKGPFGPLEMGGMFTVLKVRDRLVGGGGPGWYTHPPGTVAGPTDER